MNDENKSKNKGFKRILPRFLYARKQRKAKQETPQTNIDKNVLENCSKISNKEDVNTHNLEVKQAISKEKKSEYIYEQFVDNTSNTKEIQDIIQTKMYIKDKKSTLNKKHIEVVPDKNDNLFENISKSEYEDIHNKKSNPNDLNNYKKQGDYITILENPEGMLRESVNNIYTNNKNFQENYYVDRKKSYIYNSPLPVITTKRKMPNIPKNTLSNENIRKKLNRDIISEEIQNKYEMKRNQGEEQRQMLEASNWQKLQNMKIKEDEYLMRSMGIHITDSLVFKQKSSSLPRENVSKKHFEYQLIFHDRDASIDQNIVFRNIGRSSKIPQNINNKYMDKDILQGDDYSTCSLYWRNPPEKNIMFKDQPKSSDDIQRTLEGDNHYYRINKGKMDYLIGKIYTYILINIGIIHF